MSLLVNGKSTKDGAEVAFRVNEYGQISSTTSAGPGLPTQFFLTQSGDGQGTYNLNGDYSAAPVDMYYQATSQYDIYSILAAISDDGKFSQLTYGNMSAGVVTVGLKFFVRPAATGVDIPLLSGVGVKDNRDWLQLTSDTMLTDFAGTAQTLMACFHVFEQYGKPLTLMPGDRFIARLNDNFSTLTSQTIGLRGIKY